MRAPGGPNTSGDGSGGSQLDEGLLKAQGKVYRTDTYVVHWQVDGSGPLRIGLHVRGAVDWAADWLPASGSVRLARNHLLERPDYAPKDTTSIDVALTAEDCCRNRVRGRTSAVIM